MKTSCGQLGILFLICASALTSVARGQETMGILADVLKPEVADKLKLSEEQRTQFADLLKRRSSELIGLAQQLREVPPDQKEKLRNEFRVESERLGAAILTNEQKPLLEEIRVNRLGLLVLNEADVATKLNLADWQKAKVAELVGKAYAASRTPDAERVRAESERALRSEISDSQFAAWQVLAGRTPGGKIDNPQPPERKPAAPVVANVAPVNAMAGNTAAASSKKPQETPIDEVQIQMNFQATPWPEVLKWLCEQADLSLQADAMPPGSFTYRDQSRTYSLGKVLDIMSASLLNKGFALLRRDRLLMVVDLEAPMVDNMLNELAEYVPLPQLDSRGDFELVKCLFPLARLNPDEVKKEVEELLSLQGSVISLPSVGQLQVTDTAGIVRAVRDLIQRAEDPQSMRGSSITAIPLKHITANEVMDVARPLLNIPEGASGNQDISLSADTFGNTLFVNAKKTEDVQRIRDLVMSLDVTPATATDGTGSERELPVLQVHEIKSSDAELAFRVISQRLASEPTEVRMEKDPETNKLIVQARPSIHKEIDEILQLLSGQSSSFEVIELRNLDTQVAIATIKKFLGLSETGTADPNAPVIDGDLIMRRLYVKAAPTQLQQIRMLIEKLESTSASNDIGENVRIIPLPPRKIDRTMEQIEQLWQATRKRNRLRFVVPGESTIESSLPQKAIAPESSAGGWLSPRNEAAGQNSNQSPNQAPGQASGQSTRQTTQDQAVPDVPSKGQTDGKGPADNKAPAKRDDLKTSARVRSGFFVTTPQDPNRPQGPGDQRPGSGFREPRGPGRGQEGRTQSNSQEADSNASSAINEEGDDIVIMRGPGGLIVTSNDTEALAEFERLMRLVIEQSAAGSAEPTFYWLKYIKAVAAKELLDSILAGTASTSSSGSSGGLIGDMVSEVGGGLIGSLLGGSSGGISASGMSLTTGDVIIHPDPRLNALIIRANPVDLELCEQLLKVIDQEGSPISVETRGQIGYIPVVSQDAEQVASMIKGLFGERIEGAGGGGGGGGGGNNSQQRAPDPREFLAALTGGAGGSRRGGGSSQLTETKIAISVDKANNALLVMAQPSDIELIRSLVEKLDIAGVDSEEQIEVMSLKGTNLNVGMIDTALKGVLGPRAKTNTNSSSNTASNSSSNSGSSQSSSNSGDDARRAMEAMQQLRDRFGGGRPSGTGGPPTGFGGFGGFGGFRGGPPTGGAPSSSGGRGGR